jgi:hypothetical protein
VKAQRSSVLQKRLKIGGDLLGATRRVFTQESLKPGNYRERYWDPIVHVRGRIAIVWAPYEFWLDGKTSPPRHRCVRDGERRDDLEDRQPDVESRTGCMPEVASIRPQAGAPDTITALLF